jgi:hypothetical protein
MKLFKHHAQIQDCAHDISSSEESSLASSLVLKAVLSPWHSSSDGCLAPTSVSVIISLIPGFLLCSVSLSS